MKIFLILLISLFLIGCSDTTAINPKIEKAVKDGVYEGFRLGIKCVENKSIDRCYEIYKELKENNE